MARNEPTKSKMLIFKDIHENAVSKYYVSKVQVWGLP